MRKLELYNTTLKRVTDIQRQLSVHKEKFLEGQSEYLLRVNDRITSIRNEEDAKKKYGVRVLKALASIGDFKNQKGIDCVKDMNGLLIRTQSYLNIIHDVEMTETKLHTLISQAELLEEQALAQEKLTFINTLVYYNDVTLEGELNSLISEDENPNLANLNPDRQKLCIKAFSYAKDLMPNARVNLLKALSKDIYECVKDIEDMNEVLEESSLNQMSPIVLNSLSMVLMENNNAIEEKSDEEDSVYYYDELFGQTGWHREYEMNEFVDINGIVDQDIPLHQVIITEIANRIEATNKSYETIENYIGGMDKNQNRDIYLMTIEDYKNKYETGIDAVKVKKMITYSAKEGSVYIDAVRRALRMANRDSEKTEIEFKVPSAPTKEEADDELTQNLA